MFIAYGVVINTTKKGWFIMKKITIWVCGGCTVNNPPKLIMEDIR